MKTTYTNLRKVKPYCIWFTGMPNAGKSTLAYHLLQKKLRHCIVLDGDKFREHINPELSFSRDNILTNNKNAIKMIKYLMGEGFNVLVAMITPFQEIRDIAKREINNYIEVYVDCPEEVRSTRPSFHASQIAYEPPIAPDVIIKTDKETIDQSIATILDCLERKRNEV